MRTGVPAIIGVDSGKKGALAVLDPEGALVFLADMPTKLRYPHLLNTSHRPGTKAAKEREKKLRKQIVDQAALLQFLKAWKTTTKRHLLVIVEKPTLMVSRPGDTRATSAQGTAWSFQYYGLLVGLLLGLGIARREYGPRDWQKVLIPDVTGEDLKPASVAEAARRYPEAAHLFRGPRGGLRDGRSDALLIATHGRERYIKETQK